MNYKIVLLSLFFLTFIKACFKNCLISLDNDPSPTLDSTISNNKYIKKEIIDDINKTQSIIYDLQNCIQCMRLIKEDAVKAEFYLNTNTTQNKVTKADFLLLIRNYIDVEKTNLRRLDEEEEDKRYAYILNNYYQEIAECPYNMDFYTNEAKEIQITIDFAVNDLNLDCPISVYNEQILKNRKYTNWRTKLCQLVDEYDRADNKAYTCICSMNSESKINSFKEICD